LAPQGARESSATVEEVSRLLGEDAAKAAGSTRRRKAGFSRTEVSPGLRSIALLLGVFLAYAVLRIQELYPALDVPNLPLIMAIVLALTVVGATPFSGWKEIWLAVPPVRWQALLLVLGIVTAPFGIWMSGSLTYYLFTYSVSVIVFLVTVVILRDRRAMAVTLRLLLIAIGVVAAYTLSDAATTMGKTDRVRFGITLDPNDLAILFVALVPMALYMAVRKGGRSVGWTAVAVLCAVGIVPTQSRGAILGIGAVAVALIALGTSGTKRTLYVLGTVAVAVAIFSVASATGADRITDFSDYSGGESRTAIWKRGLVWMTWRPWGYGMDNFAIYFGWLNGNERAAHNSFIQIGVDLGVLALLAFAMLYLHTGRELLRQRRHALSLRDGAPEAEREAALASFVIAMMAGTAVAGFFLSKAYSGITLFAQGLGIAVLLGYPYWNRTGDAAAPAAEPSGRRRTAPAARPPLATGPPSRRYR
jgi:O-antigen ligase